jgi:DNA-binding protein HU-beta
MENKPTQPLNFYKAEFISFLSESSGSSKAKVSRVMDAFFVLLKKVEEDGGSITLVGKLSIKQVVRGAKKGRNPQNGESIDIPEKKILSIKFRG